MIASLYGKLEKIRGDSAVINVNGVGFLVHVPTSTMVNLGGTGQDVRLITQMIVREDNISLYGFSTESELELFQILLTVSGLGPRLALAMLSTLSVEQLGSAITGENATLLTSISGIGKKMASRLILELKDKIGPDLVSAPDAEIARNNAEVISALTSLGYSVAEASRAVAGLPSDDLSLEEKIRLALQYFTD
jgi:Holliday junction DNA helicase RuvA